MCAWGKVTPEELKEAGLDPDRIKNLEGKLDGVASKEELKTVTDSLASIKDSLVALTSRTQLDSTERQNTDGNNNNGGNNNRQTEPPPDPFNIDPVSFMEDPSGNIKKIVQASIAGTQLHTLGVAADMAYQNAKNTLPHFALFEEEIKKEWDKYQIVQKGKPNELIENIYYLVKGRHADEIATDTAKREGKYNIIQAGGTTVIRKDSNTQGKPEDNLTPQELQIAAKWGMTPEDYAKSKGGLKYV